jgi:hypothetical protein
MNNRSEATVLVGDFLSTSRETLSATFNQNSVKIILNTDCKSSSGSGSGDSHPTSRRVFAIGSPPFSNCRLQDIRSARLLRHSSTDTTGDDHIDGADTDLLSDYPLLFLTHCAHQLGAERIAFLLPERCNKSSFVESALRALNSPVSCKGLVLEDDDVCRQNWTLAKTVPGDGKFEFAGKIVRLPCVIQLWQRENKC